MRPTIANTLLLVFSILFVFARPLFACSCFAKPTVLEAYESSQNVVVARIVSLEKFSADDERNRISRDGIRAAEAVVERVYKGKMKVGSTFLLGQGGGADCIWVFGERHIGSSFLFYLVEPGSGRDYLFDDALQPGVPRFYAGECGRSRSLAEAEMDDLKYLDNMEKHRGQTRLSGLLTSWRDYGPRVSGIPVTISSGKKTWHIKTDADGLYEIYGLPPGDYVVEPKLPSGWEIDPETMSYSHLQTRNGNFRAYPSDKPGQLVVELEDGRHAGTDIFVRIKNQVSGKIIGPEGQPLKGVYLLLVRTDTEILDSWSGGEASDDDGEFRIDCTRQGTYVLVANSNDKLSDDEPFHRIFYPGVTDRKLASTFTLDAGVQITDLVFQIPQLVELVEFRGTLTYSDGNPVADHWVNFKADAGLAEFEPDSMVRTNSVGEFVLKLPKGIKGILMSDKYEYLSADRTCKKLAEAIKATGKSSFTFETRKVEIDATKSVQGIRLILPIPSCKE